jgi:hypothetical protein
MENNRMKPLLEEIPIEKYDDAEYCFDYLHNNQIIGDDEDADFNGLFHIHWTGPIDNCKIILQIKSILATQQVKKIYLWNDNFNVTFMSPFYAQLNQFRKYVEVKAVTRECFDELETTQKIKDRIWQMYQTRYGDRRIRSDIFRQIVVSVYGGVYTDADTLLLRDLSEIKIKNWSSKWGRDSMYEFCITKQEKGSKVFEQMFNNNPKNNHAFSFSLNNIDMNESSPFHWNRNLDLICLPGNFFDPVWPNWEIESDQFPLNIFDMFFEKTDKDITLNNFFEGCFAYHWHNHWDVKELKDSFAGKLNQDIDKKIKDKYNITPISIFNL